MSVLILFPEKASTRSPTILFRKEISWPEPTLCFPVEIRQKLDGKNCINKQSAVARCQELGGWAAGRPAAVL